MPQSAVSRIELNHVSQSFTDNSLQVQLFRQVSRSIVQGQSYAITAPGIEPAIFSHITDAGVKRSQSTGFGFGLSIVKRLCEHQGWQMAVQSVNGTTVTVCFPQ